MTVEEYVNRYFDDNGSPLSGLNNIKVDTAIITHDIKKAEQKLCEIYSERRSEVIHFINGKYDRPEIRLKDGTRYIVLNPNATSKGYRCKKAIIDRNITIGEFEDYVSGICLYCGKNDISFF